MDNNMLERAELALAKKKKRSVWLRIVSVLGCVVVFCTTYALILPAITMTRQTVCGLEEHAHTVQCYETRTVEGETVLSCGAEEELHTHTDSCYDSNHVPVCGYANYYVHVHNDRCYEGDTLVCDLQEIKEHTHEGSCFEREQKLICTLEEGGETHTHDDACYSQEKTLTCELEEGGEVHVHEDGCYAQEQTLTCGQEEAEGVHAHSGECYTTESKLVCEKEERTEVHTHTDECYNTTSTLTCEKEEVTETHTHGEECYETVETLTCRKTEVKLHTHGSSCFRTEEDGSETLVCTQVQVLEHVHSDSCFAPKTEQVVICGLEEHSHVDECYPAEETTGPTENETIPTEGEAVPTEGETTPDGDENAPTEGETTPIEDEDEPTEGETVPAETVPAEETTPAGDGTISAEVEETAPVFLSDGTTTEVASGTWGDNLTWTITELDGVQTLTISGEGAMTNNSGDSSLPWSSYKATISHIEIETGVTAICYYAFNDCSNVTSIEIPDSVTSIDHYAFYGCSSLTSIDIPDSVTSIGEYVFQECSSLASITLPESLTKIGNYTFYGCGLTIFDIPDSVTSIGYYAFADCSNLTEINLPTGKVTFGDAVFSGCTGLDTALRNLRAGEYTINEQDIMYNLADGCAYIAYCPADIVVPETIVDEQTGEEYPVASGAYVASGTDGDVNWLIVVRDGVSTMTVYGEGEMSGAYDVYPDYYGRIEVYTPWSSYGFERLEVMEGVTYIAPYAFYDEYGLKTAVIADSVSAIGDSAFYNTGLTSIKLPEGLKTIGSSAFASCDFKTVEIPEGVTQIGASAFQYCENLTNVSIPDGVKTIGKGAFNGCDNLYEIDLPTGYVTIGASAFSGSELDQALQDLPAGEYYITAEDLVYNLIGNYAFAAYCPDGVTVPEMLEIAEGETYKVFEGDYIAHGTVGEDVYWILYNDGTENVLLISGSGDMTYYSDYKKVPWYSHRNEINRVMIEKGVTSIGGHVFEYCGNLTEVSIPEGLTKIDFDAFANSGITSIVIPEGLTEIRGSAFAYSSLNSIDLPESLTSLGASAFYGCENLTSVNISGGLASIDSYAFYKCSQLTDVNISEGVTSIGRYAFYGCSSLTSIDIPDSVDTIEEQAFNNCSGLTSVDLPTGFVTFGQGIFTSSSTLSSTLRFINAGDYYIDAQDAVYAIVSGYAIPEHLPAEAVLPEILVTEETGEEYIVLGTDHRASGTAGQNIEWVLYTDAADGKLVLAFFGSGDMTDYSNYNGAPWYTYRTMIDRIEIDEDVTSIGDHAFYGCSRLTSIEIPDSVTSIGNDAFNGCSSLTEIDLPTGLVTLKSSVFYRCTGLDAALQGLVSGEYYIDGQPVVYCLKESYAFACYQPEGAVLPETLIVEDTGETYTVIDGTVTASGTAGTGVYWVLYNDGTEDVLLIYGSGSMGNYSSASSVPWYSSRTTIDRVEIKAGVTAIAGYAFHGCSNLTSIEIPDSVRSIENYAFYGCSSLTSIDIPDTLSYISSSTFYNCSSLTSVDIPDSVTSIGDSAFRGCSSATSINIPEGVTAIPSWTFQNCSSLTSIRFPASLKTIDYNAFSGCTDLETIYMDASQMTSCNVAFTGCSSLKNIVVGKNVDVLYTNLFSRITNNTGKTIDKFNITFEGPNYFTLDADYQFGEDLSFLAAGNNYFVDENGAIYLVDNGVAYYLYSPMSAYIAPKTIPTEAFDGTTYPVYSTKLPDVVKHNDGLTWFVYEGEELVITGACDIPNYNETGAPWYSYGSEIKEIVLADTITGIGNFAFNGFSRVTEVDIPRDATTVSTSAFRNCDSLRNFVLDAENTTFSEVNGILYNPEQTTLILCPTAKRSATDIPATVTTIGNYSFAFNDSLTGVTLPEGVTTIEANAFYDCDGLKRITIPGETVTVGENAFYDCDGLTTVRVTAENAEIGKNAFYDCDAVTAVTVTSQASAIGEGAFRSCDALQKLDVRSEAVTLGEYACYDCTALEQVSLAVLPAEIPAHAFGNCGAMTAFDVPAGYTVIGEGAFSGTNLTPWNLVKSGLHYVDEQGALYWICDGLAYYVGCPETVTDYQMLSLTPKIGDYGPYPVDSDSTAGDFLDYGTTGDLYWYIVDDNGRQTLVITGEGEMPDYTSGTAPWNAYIDDLDDIVVKEGVTTIGDYAFSGTESVPGTYRSATLPDTVTSIGKYSFYFSKKMTEIDIPDGVTTIGERAFSGGALKKVDIPYGVETINGCAFASTPLEYVSLPNSLKHLGSRIFWDTKLKEITIPGSITSMYRDAVMYCLQLEKLTIEEGLTLIGPYMFSSCPKLTEVIIPDTVKSIGNGAFQSCSSLTEIVIPDSVTSMGVSVFNGCTKLEQVTLSANLKSIPEGTFQYCTSLKSIEIPDGVTSIGKSAFLNCAELAQIVLPEGYVTVDATAFSGTPLNYLSGTIYTDANGVQYKIIDSKAYVVFQPEGVADDMIPDYIDETGNNYPVVKDHIILASGQCGANLYWEIIKEDDLVTLHIYGTGDMYNFGSGGAPWNQHREVIDALVIEEGAASVGNGAFSGCINITEASLPDGLATIGLGAFSGCSSLTSIDMPDSVTSFATNAFQNCRSLTSVDLSDNIKAISNGAFQNCSSLTSIEIPDGVTTIVSWAFAGCSSLTDITIPDSVVSLGDQTFSGCTSLTSIDIPDSVTALGAGVFSGCTSLTEVTLPDSLITIGNSAFNGCSSLKQIDIPDSVTTIGDSAFEQCDSLTEFVFPENMEANDIDTLFGCDGVSSVTITKNMKSLALRSFYWCSNLKTVYLRAEALEKVSYYAFQNCWKVFTVIVEPGVDTLYSAIFDSIHNYSSWPTVNFAGPNHFTIDPSFSQETMDNLKGDLIHLMAPGGSYYIDEQGVLYEISDGAATLLYVPAGITEFTVPAVIPAADEGEETVPVIGVATGALEAATDLTALVFESPENITILADGCMANCPTLLNVNGFTTVREAKEIFANDNLTMGEGILENTGLVSELEEWLSQRQTSEENVVISGDGIKATVITSTEQNAATEGNLAFYTGQLAKISVFYERTGENSSETVRVYFHFSEPGMSFSPELGQKEYDAVTLDGADSYKFQVTIGKLPYTNIYYLDLPVLKPGHTVEIPVETLYPSGSSGGGELRIWAEVIENEETTVISDGTQKLIWVTEPFDFNLTKKVRVQPKFSGDGTEGSSFAIYDLSYEVKLSPVGNSRNALSGLGYDAMTRAEFVDVLTFPESENGQKLTWADGVTEAVANGEWVSQKYLENNKQVGWEVAVPIDGQLKTLLAVRDTAVTDLNVSLTENGDIAFGWTKANGNINTPNPTFTQYVDVGDGMIVGESITDLNEDKEFQLHNDVSAAQYFRFSDIQEDQAQCDHIAATNAAVMEAKKTADRGYTAYFGESYPYTITLKNTGTQHLHALNKIEDDLPADLYITPADMFEMLTEGRDGEYLTITISEATIYNQLPEGITVTGTDGKEYVPDIQNTSIETWYHGMEEKEAAGCIASTGAKLVLKQAEGGVSVSLNGGEARLASSGDELRQVLFDLGYFVTPLARYSVTWEFPEGTPMWSSEERDYHILSTVKDAFMAISWDHTWTPIWDGSEPVESKSMNANAAKISYMLSEGGAQVSGEPVEVPKETTLKRDFWVNTEYWTGTHDGSLELVEGGGLVNLCVSVDHDGTASYDMVPFVSQMTGAQILVVRVSDNPHLAAEEYGLTVRTIGGIDYYLLDRDGEYPNVMIGGYLADCVKVDVNDNNPNDITTQMRWYLTNIKGSMEMHIDCKVLMVTNGEITDSSVFGVDNEVWLNDHQTHRLWASMGSKWSFASFDKQIVTNHVEGTSVHDVTDPDDETILHDGDSVTYRLKITGMLSSSSVQAGRTVIVPGTAIYDQLPKSTTDWEFGKNIQKIEYVYDDTQVDIEGLEKDCWTLTNVDPETGETEDDQQYIVWNDMFQIIYKETSTVYIYVTLDYPEGADWAEYCNSYGSDMLINTMYFSNDNESVRHSLDMSASAKLVKGVSSTGVWKNNTYYPSTDSNSRFNYASEDNLDRIVTYYVALYNDGNTRLYLDDIQDKLPAGFTYRNNSEVVASDIVDIGDKSGQEVTYKKAVIGSIVDESTGNIRFTAGNGAKKDDGTYPGDLNYDEIYERYYLLPREALVFSYQCFVGPGAEAGIRGTNTAAMAYFDYNLCGVNVGSSTVTAENAEQIFNNDGDCSVIADSTAGTYGFSSELGEGTQWLMSQVQVEKGNIVPGIEKRVSSVQSSHGNEMLSKTQATYYDYVTWEVTTSNIGTTPMRDYVLTDVMQQTYDFEGEIVYTIYYGSNYVDNKDLTISGTLFSMNDLKTNGVWNEASKQYTMSVDNKIFGLLDVSYTPHSKESPATLAIHFRSAKAAIPEGGESVLTVTTRNHETYMTSTYTNTCYVTPAQSWDERLVTTGVPESYNDKLSVRNSADIAVDSAYLTASLKEVTEKINPDNHADSDDEVNSIVLSSGQSVFTYTLKVQNTGQEKDVMEKLVIIDNLPEIGDHSALKDTDPRYSEFAVWLAENPNFTVTVGGETLEPGAYDLQFTTKTSFSDDDWAGIGTGWDAASAEARAFRIILTGTVNEEGTYSGTVVPANTLVTVSFDAMIRAEDLTDGNALPGEIAWNSFGYNYRLFGSNVELASIPGKVGVKLPSIPQMIKKLETPDGRAWKAEKEQTFSYLVYALDEGLDLPELEGLTEAQIGEELQKADARFTRVCLTVPKGASESELLVLKDLHHWSVANGVWTEGSEEWTWTQGGKYVFVELPIEVAEGEIEEYTFGTINGNHRNHFLYVHDQAETATIVGMNLRRVWNISLLKVSDGKQASPLSGAWFGLYGKTAPAEAPVLPDALRATMTEKDFEKLLTLEYTEEEKTATWYLQKVDVSGSDGILLWQDLTDEQYLVQEIQAPEGYHYDDTVHVVQRPEDVIFNTANMSVVNRSGYEMPKSGGIGTNAVTTMGALLIAASGVMLLLLKRRRKGAKA